MKNLILLILLFFCSLVQAQEGNFVYTKDKKFIKGKEVQQVSKLFGSDYFKIDNEKVKTKNVLFYQDDYGFYGRVKGGDFAVREEKGSINIFYLQRVEYNNFNNGFNNGFYNRPFGYNRFGGNYGNNFGQVTEDFYYNKKPLSPLKRISYKNLKADLKDNSKSFSELKKYKNKARFEYGMYVLGALATAYGGYKAFNDDRFSSSALSRSGTSIMVSGLVTIGIGSLIHKKRKKHLIKAIEIYNE